MRTMPTNINFNSPDAEGVCIQRVIMSYQSLSCFFFTLE